MALFTDGWVRIEGNVIPDLNSQYGSFSHLSPGIKIFYGQPEIQLFNKTNAIHGVVYKVVPLSEFGYNTIQEIDSNYPVVTSDINSFDNTVDISDAENSAQFYYNPFVLLESSVIYYGDSTVKMFDHKALVLVDKYATPNIVTIAAQYKGKPVPIGDKFSLDDIQVFAVYSDGNKALIHEGYTVNPADKIITSLGSNVIIITYVTPNGEMYKAQIAIEGTRKLVGISAIYDGPKVAIGQEVQRKFIIVVAEYSDGSTATITDYTFPSGKKVTEANGGVLTIFYNFYTELIVDTYTVTSSRLIAYYNGPNVEVGHNFNTDYVKVKIYYQSSDAFNSYYEDVNPSDCTFSNTMIDHEGITQVLVQYTSKTGLISTYMIVSGILPVVKLNFIEAQYTGPDIIVGSAFSTERLIVKAHYSDGSIVTVKNGFILYDNIVHFIGNNEFRVSFKDKDNTVETTFSVNGLEKDSTTDNNYYPISLQNNYPEATRFNNRYRGPAEGIKHNNINMMIFANIQTLYDLYANIEQNFNQLIDACNGANSIRIKSLNDILKIEDTTKALLTDERFSTGYYIKEVSS